jgi:hypothetical protein
MVVYCHTNELVLTTAFEVALAAAVLAIFNS